MTAPQQILNSGARNIVAPEIARIGGHLGRRLGGPVSAVGAADLDDADTGCRRQQPRGFCRAQRIFHITQVPDYAKIDVAPAKLARSSRFARGLENDAKLFAKPFWNDAPRQTVQCNEPLRQLHRSQRRLGVFFDVLVDIGPAELEDQPVPRIANLKAAYCLGAAPSMNGDHCIGELVFIVSRDGHAVAEAPQNARPTERRDGIARSCTRARRSDKNYFHGSRSVRTAQQRREPRGTGVTTERDADANALADRRTVITTADGPQARHRQSGAVGDRPRWVVSRILDAPPQSRPSATDRPRRRSLEFLDCSAQYALES